MKRILFLLVFLVFASAANAQQSYVAVDEESTTSTNNAVSTSSTTTQETVQIKNTYKYWRSGDEVVIANYLAKHKAKLNSENYNVLRVGLRQIVGDGSVDARDSRGTLILNQPTKHYIQMIQELYKLTSGGLDFYVNHTEQPQAPVQKLELPAFAGGSIPDLAIKECLPFEKPKEREKSLCAVPQIPTGAVAVFHPGDRQESTIAYGSKSWTNIPRPKCIVKPPETCDPNGTPPSKPPTSAPVGNPSGLNPGGPPASGGPPAPTGDQAPVKIGDPSVTWNVTPTHPNVADSVN